MTPAVARERRRGVRLAEERAARCEELARECFAIGDRDNGYAWTSVKVELLAHATLIASGARPSPVRKAKR